MLNSINFAVNNLKMPLDFALTGTLILIIEHVQGPIGPQQPVIFCLSQTAERSYYAYDW